MRNPTSQRVTLLSLGLAILLGACRSAPDSPVTASLVNSAATSDLNAALARAAGSRQPLIVLVAESGQSRADDAALALFASPAIQSKIDHAEIVLLDVAVSRNRAIAARFHVSSTPLLFCLSSRGIIISRDEKDISRNLILQRLDEATSQSPGLDAQFLSLAAAARNDPGGIAAQFVFSDFLLAHHNDSEAIPILTSLAHSATDPPASRVRAWVALTRAHVWVAEPEKARHEAGALLAELGATNPEARAGAGLVLGTQDATAKRTDLARKELESAITAAPDSPYGHEAAAALANLPKGTK